MQVLLLDNIDSFTYNILHYLEGLDCSVTVIDNKTVLPADIQRFDCLIISPGPGLPSEAGNLLNVLDTAVKVKMPILGICLGMQAIAEYFGGGLFNQPEVKHGKQETIRITGKSQLFKGIPENFKVGLYHSWAVRQDLPSTLLETASSESGIMMALEHESLPVFGVQFHPESIMSEWGIEILGNFLENLRR